RDLAPIEGPAGPLAEGARLPWAALPSHVMDTLVERMGSSVASAEDRPGGFSPGVAARLRLADGRRLFIKAVSSSLNPESPQMHRAEARIAGRLPPFQGAQGREGLVWLRHRMGWP